MDELFVPVEMWNFPGVFGLELLCDGMKARRGSQRAGVQVTVRNREIATSSRFRTVITGTPRWFAISVAPISSQ